MWKLENILETSKYKVCARYRLEKKTLDLLDEEQCWKKGKGVWIVCWRRSAGLRAWMSGGTYHKNIKKVEDGTPRSQINTRKHTITKGEEQPRDEITGK